MVEPHQPVCHVHSLLLRVGSRTLRGEALERRCGLQVPSLLVIALPKLCPHVTNPRHSKIEQVLQNADQRMEYEVEKMLLSQVLDYPFGGVVP